MSLLRSIADVLNADVALIVYDYWDQTEEIQRALMRYVFTEYDIIYANYISLGPKEYEWIMPHEVRARVYLLSRSMEMNVLCGISQRCRARLTDTRPTDEFGIVQPFE